MKAMAALGISLALTACGDPSPSATPGGPGGQGQSPSATRGDVDETAPPPPTSPPPVPAGVPDTTKRVSPGKLTLPTAFQGHWGLTPADCDISRPDAPGLMKVSGATLDFHDATAKAYALTARDPYRITADLDFKVGDRSWQRREVLTLEMGGTRFARTEAGKTLRYEKC